MEPSDAELIRRCLAGEDGAWYEIVKRHEKRVYNLAYRYSGRFDQAEDLTQEIFLKVYRSLSAYRPGAGTFGAWLIRLSRNHIIDRYRKFKTERSKTDSGGTRGGQEHRRKGLQAGRRSSHHPAGQVPAGDESGRVPAALERAERRHESGWS